MSGDVIPIIQLVILGASKGQLPRTLNWRWKNEIDIEVVDEDDYERKIKAMEHFMVCLQVDGVRYGVIRKLYDAGIQSIEKLLTVSEKELIKIPGFKERTASMIYTNLRNQLKRTTLWRLYAALGCAGYGFSLKRSKAFFQHVQLRDLDPVRKFNEERLFNYVQGQRNFSQVTARQE